MTARIRRSAQFGAFAGGTRRRRGPLMMTVAPSVQPGAPRVGYAIGRGIGSAVVRNRLRRRLRHAMADLTPRLDPNLAYLVGTAKGASLLTYGEITRLLSDLAGDVARVTA